MTQNPIHCSRCRGEAFTPRITLNTAELTGKLRSEFGPTGVDVQQIKRMLLSCDRDLEDYDAELVRLQSQMLYLRAQKERLRDYRAKLRSLLSPVRKLPNELLFRIFEFTHASNYITQHPGDEHAPPFLHGVSSSRHCLPALSISAVCSRWRQLALVPSSTRLWSNLMIMILPTTNSAISEKFLSILRHYLARSAHHPLTIQVIVFQDEREGSFSSDLAFWGLLMEHVHRWQSFSYFGSPTLSDQEPFSQTNLSFLILESLDLSHSDDIIHFGDVPMLRSLSTPSSTPSFIFPLSQLTSLRCILTAEPTQILMLCPNASHLDLIQSRHEAAYFRSSPTAHIKSDKVESLRLDLENPSSASSFLEAIFQSYTLPSLKKLYITSGTCGPVHPWPKQALHGFIGRSSCTVTSLSISDIGISDLDPIFIFHLLPSIVDLCIVDPRMMNVRRPITAHLISNLRGGELDEQATRCSPLLPKLQHLSLKVNSEEFDDAAMVDMVSSRWLPDRNYAAMLGQDCLRSLKLHFDQREVDNAIYSPLRVLDKMGMRVSITGRGEIVLQYL